MPVDQASGPLAIGCELCAFALGNVFEQLAAVLAAGGEVIISRSNGPRLGPEPDDEDDDDDLPVAVEVNVDEDDDDDDEAGIISFALLPTPPLTAVDFAVDAGGVGRC